MLATAGEMTVALGDRARSEQLADQPGSVFKALAFLGARRGDFGFDPREHRRECDGERDERLVEVGGVVHFGSYAVACQAGWHSGLTMRHRSARGYSSRGERPYILAPRTLR